MFTLLSGIRVNSANRPYLGSISSNLNPHGFSRPAAIRVSSGTPILGASSMSGPGASPARVVGSSGGGPFRGLGEGAKVQLLEIVLDKDKPVFEPGQEVTGKLVLICNGVLRFRSLSVTMRGVARVHWTEARAASYRMVTSRRHFNAEIEYFNKKRYLVSPISANGDRHVLPEGRHEMAFRFQLPESTDISTSFEGRFGSVRYFIRADLDQSWAKNHRAKRAFTVISPIDVNREQELEPVYREADTTLCCWLCTSGEISMAVATDRKGYCPGESVAIDASFVNQSTRRVLPEATLCQTQTFSAGGKSRTKRTRMTTITGRAVAGGSEMNWDAMLLKIPPVSPSILNCRLIKVEYAIIVTLVIPGSCSLSLQLPIVIGTVPYRPLSRQSSGRHTGICSSVTSPFVSLPDEPPESVESQHEEQDLPPSYLECVDNECTSIMDPEDYLDTASLHGETRFYPLYRYVTDYHYQPPPAYSEVDPFPVQSVEDLVPQQ